VHIYLSRKEEQVLPQEGTSKKKKNKKNKKRIALALRRAMKMKRTRATRRRSAPRPSSLGGQDCGKRTPEWTGRPDAAVSLSHSHVVVSPRRAFELTAGCQSRRSRSRAQTDSPSFSRFNWSWTVVVELMDSFSIVLASFWMPHHCHFSFLHRFCHSRVGQRVGLFGCWTGE